MTTSINLVDFLTANKAFKKDFEDGGKPLPPRRKAMVITCMDPRVPIEAAMGIKNGECGVVRNAGGRITDDVLKSILFGTAMAGLEEIYVVHHNDCGLTKCSDKVMHQMVEKKLGKGAAEEARNVDWRMFTDVKQSLVEDREILEKSPFVPDSTALHFMYYDVNTGGIEEVEI